MTAEPVTIPGGARRARRVTRRGHPVTPPGSPLFGRLGAILERVAAIAGRLEAIFGPSWGPRGPPRSHLQGQISASRLQNIIAFCVYFLYLYFFVDILSHPPYRTTSNVLSWLSGCHRGPRWSHQGAIFSSMESDPGSPSDPGSLSLGRRGAISGQLS